MTVLFWLEIACACVLAGCLFCFLLLLLCAGRDEKKRPNIPAAPLTTRFAILIPARNESRVIESNLRALARCDYPTALRKQFVIVESMEDPTVGLCQKYENTEVYLRKNFDRPGKGPAMDECLKSIFASDEHFDAVLILDADNVVAPNFLSRLNDAFAAGFDAACGKRNNKDWNASAVSAASALTFTVVNTLQNKPKAARGMNVVFTGTGFYVRYDILKRLGGWPFVTMTEDYEFSTFALCNGITTTYVEDAVYYDEQPTRLWPSIVQRTRWVKGFFTVQHRYKKMKKAYAKRSPKSRDMRAIRWGTLPAIVAVIDLIFYIFLTVGGAIYTAILGNGWLWSYLARLGLALGALYFGIALFTAWLFYIERKEIDITRAGRIKATLFHPVFLASYLVSVCRIPLMKNKWEVIEHTCETEPVK